MSDKLSDKMDALYGGYAKTIAKQNCRIADLERQLAEARSILKDQRKVLIEAGELLDKDAIIADLERQLAAALKERDNWKQIVQDDCDAENDWRTAAGEWDKSDSYCIESAATVIERMKAELEARKPK